MHLLPDRCFHAEMRRMISNLFGFTVAAVASLAVTGNAAAQLAPRHVVAAGESIAYRDVEGEVACRTDALSSTCISRTLEKLFCDATRCELSSASEGEWLALREASDHLYVHPHTENWSSVYGVSGCIAHDGGGFICQSSEGNREGIPATVRSSMQGYVLRRLLAGSWSPDCAAGDAITYFRNSTLEGNRRVGRWRIEGDILTENYVVLGDPSGSSETDMRYTLRSQITANDDGSILRRGEWLSGGDVPPDVVLMRCEGTSQPSDLQ